MTDNNDKKIIAKKDFVICHNEYFYDIKKGDNINELNIPKKFLENLKTEKVI